MLLFFPFRTGSLFPRFVPRPRVSYPRSTVNRYFPKQPDRRGFAPVGGLGRPAAVPGSLGPQPPYLSANSTKVFKESGLLRESLLAASSGGVPERIFVTGTSSFLPFKV